MNIDNLAFDHLVNIKYWLQILIEPLPLGYPLQWKLEVVPIGYVQESEVLGGFQFNLSFTEVRMNFQFSVVPDWTYFVIKLNLNLKIYIF